MSAPQFVERDPDKITRELVAQYEELSNRTLYPAQLERLLINVIAYRETLIREAIQDAATQNLVKYARAPMLDELGVLVGCTRLPATSAQTKLRFTLSERVAVETRIPVGTRVESSNGDVVFSTIEPLTLSPNTKSGDVWAQCETAGSVGDGWLVGAINRIIDNVSNVATAENITQTEGGADAETDEHYRARIMLAPETFSVAGSVEAYQYHAMSAHPDIVDVAIESPEPGDVIIYPLTLSGLPTETVIKAVLDHCSGRKVRPLTDRVTVEQPESVKYAVSANLTLFETADEKSTIANAVSALNAWIQEKAAVLGRDIVPSQIIAALSVEGVYQVELTSPAETIVILPRQWALCTKHEVKFAGTSEG